MSVSPQHSARGYRLGVVALAVLGALIFLYHAYSHEVLVQDRARWLSGFKPLSGDPEPPGPGMGFPFQILFWLVLTIVATVEAVTLRGYRWCTSRVGSSETQPAGSLAGSARVSDAIGRGVQLFRVRSPERHFVEIAELPGLPALLIGRRRVLKARSENVWYALLTIPYKDEEEIIVRGPSAHWENWDWTELADVADSCRWRGVGSAPRYVL